MPEGDAGLAKPVMSSVQLAASSSVPGATAPAGMYTDIFNVNGEETGGGTNDTTTDQPAAWANIFSQFGFDADETNDTAAGAGAGAGASAVAGTSTDDTDADQI